MKKLFLFIISTLYIFAISTLSVAATAGQEMPVADEKALYAVIIAILCATIGVMIYVISTYFKK